ncbi:MAG: hypothetical protein KatS3mg081_0592 [Gemmatimonadales bacterium]|nr:MAG: hypothetical protein KatS3mg081_0592 [Gemmatimonadales bacterium]
MNRTRKLWCESCAKVTEHRCVQCKRRARQQQSDPEREFEKFEKTRQRLTRLQEIYDGHKETATS